jgi:hypothetical protein
MPESDLKNTPSAFGSNCITMYWFIWTRNWSCTSHKYSIFNEIAGRDGFQTHLNIELNHWLERDESQEARYGTEKRRSKSDQYPSVFLSKWTTNSESERIICLLTWSATLKSPKFVHHQSRSGSITILSIYQYRESTISSNMREKSSGRFPCTMWWKRLEYYWTSREKLEIWFNTKSWINNQKSRDIKVAHQITVLKWSAYLYFTTQTQSNF